MVPENLSNPQFVADTSRDEAAPDNAPADHSDENMARLRHPFETQPAAAPRVPAPGAPAPVEGSAG
ncbi:hypothetical protein GCM10010435_27750 [Winogradskya consettensis]|uniref:Uncharacterized protein n=1 Tax=Winogradskya consettensis TaxID=113560 RepID=A0A919SHF9_9ACTN|nr:hypothetical protein [Actinoplanes consettensis]GIM71093.1 hypothetical protein Aco04nite_23750 [Actinoplanes consettensis]